MDAVNGGVRVVQLEAVEPIPLPNDSWSRMVLDAKSLGANSASLGYSVFEPGTVLAPVCHEVEELAYVVAGQGELRLDAEVTVPFGPNDALYIPANTWHAVANTGDGVVIMVFTFPHPSYPPTQRR
jgi:quercetin dioxygenase-like cupin family protein